MFSTSHNHSVSGAFLPRASWAWHVAKVGKSSCVTHDTSEFWVFESGMLRRVTTCIPGDRRTTAAGHHVCRIKWSHGFGFIESTDSVSGVHRRGCRHCCTSTSYKRVKGRSHTAAPRAWHLCSCSDGRREFTHGMFHQAREVAGQCDMIGALGKPERPHARGVVTKE